MHPPLHRPHPDCESHVFDLENCHATQPYAKFFGVCNDYKMALDKCFREEKERMRRENMNKGRKEEQDWQKEWREVRGRKSS
mmetsp:Transcript_4106/g.8241  ORF Transcript_4106/g.8241 Transcript_4106/m.8241 type:complete len:82 (-) Transcript_4106:49-294(-)